jgi:hypothetical protein
MVSQAQIRTLALALPQTAEQDHHGRPSFRVAGRIFANLWDERHMNVMLDEPGIRTAVQSHPIVCEEFWWGNRLRAVHVDLTLADQALAGELLGDAWEQKAPKRLVNQVIHAAPDPSRRSSASPQRQRGTPFARSAGRCLLMAGYRDRRRVASISEVRRYRSS